MIIVSLTDIHGDLTKLGAVSEVLEEADIVPLTGDLTHLGHAEEAARVVEAVRRHADTVLAVSGNCDYPDVEEYLLAEGIGLHGVHRIIEGVAFCGAGGSLPCLGITPNQFKESDLAAALANGVEGVAEDMPLVLAVHQPPLNTVVDLAGNGSHVGSEAVRAFIEAHGPGAAFSGHIHEARGVDRLGETYLINPGPLREGRYGYVEVGCEGVSAEVRTAK